MGEEIDPDILTRKGARNRDAIPSTVLKLLNEGKIESANLVEWLAIDHIQLLENTFPQLGLGEMLLPIKAKLDAEKKPSIMSTFRCIGQSVSEHSTAQKTVDDTLGKLQQHLSDSVRGYACFALAHSEKKIPALLQKVKPYAADLHFGVREIAWLSARPTLSTDLDLSIALLQKWSTEEDENVRRFAAEVLRPNGVWCKHLTALKENPEQALPILEPLKNDASKYVRDSVANWLNDASKAQPEFVRTVCQNWTKASTSKETAYIVKRALRTINKK